MHRFHRAAGTAAVLVVGVVGSLGLAACKSTPDRTGSTASASSASAADPSTLRVLAGSEVKDMAPILEEARQATGVTVELHYAGTIDGAEQVASGAAGRSYDATWFSSNRYLGLLPGGNQALASSTKVMASPVVLGVRPAKATELGWDRTPPTWAQISQAAAAKKFTYGMTNPATSNSGFSALVGVATALAGGGSAIDGRRVAAVKPQLTQFFSGQRLTSGSSGWLAEQFLEQSANGQSGSGGSSQSVDGLINYESVLLGLGEGQSTASSRLTLVRPKDGVVSADYPLSLLTTAQAKRGAYQKLADWLRTPDAQRAIMQRTHRRPVVPGVPLDPAFGRQLLVELPFPAQRSTADGLIATYLDEVRRPSQTIYVLDVSGSMTGDRITQLKRAFATLSGQDVTGTEQATGARLGITGLTAIQSDISTRMFDALPVYLAIVVVLGILAVGGLIARRRWIAHKGVTFELSVNHHDEHSAPGWILGVGVYGDDAIEWFRTFSFSPRARHRFERGAVVIEGRRHPEGAEAYALHDGHIVVRTENCDGVRQLALSANSLTGLLSWLESSPPGLGVNKVL